jgi:hypothetical protein
MGFNAPSSSHAIPMQIPGDPAGVANQGRDDSSRENRRRGHQEVDSSLATSAVM